NTLNGYDLRNALLGSTALTKDGEIGRSETFGDIDIAVGNTFTISDLEKHLRSSFRGLETKTFKSMGIVSIAMPISGDENNGFVQTDFILGDIDLLKFMYKSPDPSSASKYKGLYRNVLIRSLCQSIRQTF